jgi:hypothetical protein
MATIGRVSGASFNNTPRLLYIATATFNNYFYSYSTSINAQLNTIGTLGPVVGSTSANCPRGRVLRENGRKLYPDANPGIDTYMVGVYDAQSLLSGFIDPNAQVFQIYNTDKPTYLADGVEPTLGTTDRGPSIYTRGDVLGGGNLDISGSSHIYGSELVDGGLTVHLGATIDNSAGTGLTVYNGETIATGNLLVSTGNATIATGDLNVTLGNITGGKQIRSSSVFTSTIGTSSGQNDILIDPTIGQVFRIVFGSNANNDVALTVTNMLPGAQLFFAFSNSSGSDRIFDFNAGFLSANVGVNLLSNSGSTNNVASASFFCDSVAYLQLGGQNPVKQ